MPIFKWISKDKAGKKVKGEIQALTEADAFSNLATQGIKPLKIERLKPKSAGLNISIGGLSTKEKLFFIQSLMIMVRTGVPILSITDSMEKETKNPALRKILIQMRESITAGRPLWQVFAAQKKYFHPIYAAYIKGGEETGRLKEALTILYTQIERDYELISKVRAAIIYPAILIVGVMGVLGIIFGFVLPKLKEVFLSSGVNPHPLTTFMFGLSDFVSKNFLILIGLSILMVIGLIYTFTNRRLRIKFVSTMIHVPKIGAIIKDTQITRFTRSLSASLTSGLSFPEALRLTAQVLQGKYQTLVAQYAVEIQKGVSLYSLLQKEPKLWPSTVVQIVTIGEKTGELPQVLSDVSGFYEKEADNAIRSAISLVEPALIMVMGVIVGFIVVSVVATIFTSIKSF